MNWTLVTIAAIGAAMFALRYTGRRLEAKIGQVHLIVDDVNKAVNHKPDGEPTLYEHARAANAQISELSERLSQFTAYQHDRNHDLLNKLLTAAGQSAFMDQKLEQYVADDAKAHEELREALAALDVKVSSGLGPKEPV